MGLAGVSLGIERIEFLHKAAFRGFTGAYETSPGRSPKGYLPSVSSFFFASSFIFLTVGLWLLSPVV